METGFTGVHARDYILMSRVNKHPCLNGNKENVPGVGCIFAWVTYWKLTIKFLALVEDKTIGSTYNCFIDIATMLNLPLMAVGSPKLTVGISLSSRVL